MHHRNTRNRRKGARERKPVWKKNERKIPNLEREKATQVQQAQRVPIKMNLKAPTPRHIIVKMTNFKYKERTLKAAKEK